MVVVLSGKPVKKLELHASITSIKIKFFEDTFYKIQDTKIHFLIQKESS